MSDERESSIRLPHLKAPVVMRFSRCQGDLLSDHINNVTFVSVTHLLLRLYASSSTHLLQTYRCSRLIISSQILNSCWVPISLQFFTLGAHLPTCMQLQLPGVKSGNVTNSRKWLGVRPGTLLRPNMEVLCGLLSCETNRSLAGARHQAFLSISARSSCQDVNDGSCHLAGYLGTYIPRQMMIMFAFLPRYVLFTCILFCYHAEPAYLGQPPYPNTCTDYQDGVDIDVDSTSCGVCCSLER